jgi:hypothetical protein
MGGEIRIELRFNVDWNMDRSVTVTANAKMYEGTSESTDDLDDEENAVPLIVPKDHQRSGSIRLYNEGIGGGDTSAIEYAVVNLVQDQ